MYDSSCSSELVATEAETTSKYVRDLGASKTDGRRAGWRTKRITASRWGERERERKEAARLCDLETAGNRFSRGDEDRGRNRILWLEIGI